MFEHDKASHFAIFSEVSDAQAVLVAYLEQHLFLGADEVEGEMYPAAMVIATSALGIAVGRRLQSNKKLGLTFWWITQAIFVAKLFMLVLPQVFLCLASIMTLESLVFSLCLQILQDKHDSRQAAQWI